MGDVYRDLEGMCNVALHYAEEHGCNYYVIISYPVDGCLGLGSTYEYVGDSYFEKARDCVVMMETDWVLGRFKSISSEFDIRDSTISRLTKSMLSDLNLTREIDSDLRVRNNGAGSEPFLIADYKTSNYNMGYRGYRERIEPRRVEKVPGRNDLCSCGSTKKYKKCCIKD
tara:strand:- start:4230 stop:4739 length:510 start_codon:yes stop_codon:yes gene_type:complete